MDSPLGPTCRHLDFGLLAPWNSERIYISVVLSCVVCGALSRLPQDTHTDPIPAPHTRPPSKCVRSGLPDRG